MVCFVERSLTLQTCTVVLQLYILNIFFNSALIKMLISMFVHLVLVMAFGEQQTAQQ